MIKSETKYNTKKGKIRTMGAEVIVEGNGMEVLHEFIGILDTLEKQCPNLLLKGLQIYMEEMKNDN